MIRYVLLLFLLPLVYSLPDSVIYETQYIKLSTQYALPGEPVKVEVSGVYSVLTDVCSYEPVEVNIFYNNKTLTFTLLNDYPLPDKGPCGFQVRGEATIYAEDTGAVNVVAPDTSREFRLIVDKPSADVWLKTRIGSHYKVTFKLYYGDNTEVISRKASCVYDIDRDGTADVEKKALFASQTEAWCEVPTSDAELVSVKYAFTFKNKLTGYTTCVGQLCTNDTTQTRYLEIVYPKNGTVLYLVDGKAKASVVIDVKGFPTGETVTLDCGNGDRTQLTVEYTISDRLSYTCTYTSEGTYTITASGEGLRSSVTVEVRALPTPPGDEPTQPPEDVQKPFISVERITVSGSSVNIRFEVRDDTLIKRVEFVCNGATKVYSPLSSMFLATEQCNIGSSIDLTIRAVDGSGNTSTYTFTYSVPYFTVEIPSHIEGLSVNISWNAERGDFVEIVCEDVYRYYQLSGTATCTFSSYGTKSVTVRLVDGIVVIEKVFSVTLNSISSGDAGGSGSGSSVGGTVSGGTPSESTDVQFPVGEGYSASVGTIVGVGEVRMLQSLPATPSTQYIQHSVASTGSTVGNITKAVRVAGSGTKAEYVGEVLPATGLATAEGTGIDWIIFAVVFVITFFVFYRLF